MKQSITTDKSSILDLAKQYGAKTICLFGSMTRGGVGESSGVDFLAELKQERDLFDLGELLIELQMLLQR